MSKLLTFPRGILVGATLMYFFDPRRGRARRARIADLATHTWRVEQQLVGKAARDAAHRARGLVERVSHASSGPADDAVLEARVRARLGRVVSHAGAIEAHVKRGVLTLHGAVLAHEADRAIRALRQVPGIRQVLDRLDRHATADVPALQGAGPRPPSGGWAPSGQVAAVAGGTLLALYGMVRRGIAGTALTAVGGALAARGVTNQPLARLVDYILGRAPIELHKTVNLNVPPERVFALWSRLEGFPRFLQHVRSIEVNPREPARSRWEVDGPAGIPLRFETVTTRVVPDREVTWTTLPDQPIEHTGSVRFEAVPGGTRIDIYLSYRPPGGALGHAVAHLLGWDPKSRIDDDMVRMKALLEEGQTRAHGERVTARDLVQ
ncbi:MAG TPA: SRPBCC family protein [Kofleriaceae bacterium]|nr:SRPBCC family protein [Kofleriaceae bacterium]